MQLGSVEAIIQKFNQADVRYLVAGGLAVVAHGFVRFTADLDLVLDLAPENLEKTMGVLSSIGYRPRAPVELREFANPDMRSRWVREKGLTVFSLFSDEHPATEIDLFVEEPFEFEKAYGRSVRMEIANGVPATFVSFDDLLEMKRRANRPQDVQDIESLSRIRERGTNP